MTSPRFVSWLEKKLAAAGVEKVVPDDAVLMAAYKRAVRLKELERLSAEAKEKADRMEISVPTELSADVKKAIEGTSTPWDAAVWALANAKKATP